MKRKDIVIIFNGLGNQMSQYAFYLAKRKNNPNCCCAFYTSEASHNGYELEKVFNISINSSKQDEKIIKFLLSYNIISKILRRILSFLCIFKFYYEDITTYDYDENKLQPGKGIRNYYLGGWHSPKYFESVQEDLLSIYNFNLDKLSQRNRDMVELLSINKKTLSIHFRCGDYKNPKNSNFGSVASKTYYDKAIKEINDFDSYQVLVFSDNPDWVKENFNFSNATYVDWNKKEDSWQDMFLMSLCSVNINPNSTFSWWAAWCNKNKNKIVIVPDRFIMSYLTKDFYPSSWIKIEI